MKFGTISKAAIGALSSLFILLAASGNASADYRFQVGALVSAGGDELVEVELTGGAQDDDSVTAGGGVGLWIGAGFMYSPTLEVRANIGFHRDSISASNGDTEFSRMPLELMAMLHRGPHRFGAGVHYILNPEFDFSLEQNFGQDISFGAEFDDAIGLAVQYEYVFRERTSLGLRYLQTEYSPAEDIALGDVDGSYVALVVGYKF